MTWSRSRQGEVGTLSIRFDAGVQRVLPHLNAVCVCAQKWLTSRRERGGGRAERASFAAWD